MGAEAPQAGHGAALYQRALHLYAVSSKWDKEKKKTKKITGQINLLYIFGKQSLKPIFYRTVPGNIRELSAFVLTMEESGIAPCILIMDKGFYSLKNTGYLAKNKFNTSNIWAR